MVGREIKAAAQERSMRERLSAGFVAVFSARLSPVQNWNFRTTQNISIRPPKYNYQHYSN
jgi:hypothetical protein